MWLTTACRVPLARITLRPLGAILYGLGEALTGLYNFLHDEVGLHRASDFA